MTRFNRFHLLWSLYWFTFCRDRTPLPAALDCRTHAQLERRQPMTSTGIRLTGVYFQGRTGRPCVAVRWDSGSTLHSPAAALLLELYAPSAQQLGKLGDIRGVAKCMVALLMLRRPANIAKLSVFQKPQWRPHHCHGKPGN
jgi:hypothetical protein